MRRVVISEAEFERFADQHVQARLAVDPRYKHAEDAEAQALAEDEIAEEVVWELKGRYEVR